MPLVQPTQTIAIDNSMYEVSKMSPNVQQMVVFLDEWRQKEVDVNSELLMIRGALRDLQNTLLQTIQRDRAEALAKAEAMGILPPTFEETTISTEGK